MRILGLDLAFKRTGWSLLSAKEQGKATLLERGAILTDRNDTHPAKLASLSKQLRGLLVRTKPDLVCIETPGRMNQMPYRQVATIVHLSQALGLALLHAHELGIPILEVTQDRAKEELTGNKYADKETVHAHLELLSKAGELDNYTTPRRPRGGIDYDEDDGTSVGLVGVRQAGLLQSKAKDGTAKPKALRRTV